MTYIPNWEEFAKAAERMYLTDPMKVSIYFVASSFPSDRFISEVTTFR